MRTRGRRVVVGLAGVAAVLVVAASSSFACGSLALVEVTPNVVRPGQEVTWKGTFFLKDEPVSIRWNAVDGPVLSTATPPSADNGLHGNWRFVDGAMTIPADAKPGTYVVVATQNAVKGNSTWGIPARTVVQVSDGAPIVAGAVGQSNVVRPGSLVTTRSVAAGTLALVALGAAGVAMFLVGVALAFAGRRPSARGATVPAERVRPSGP